VAAGPSEAVLLERNRHMESELELAGAFQRAVLPAMDSVPYLQQAICYEPCEPVSGDVYDFTLNRERELGIFVGDDTGHRVGAAAERLDC
jgi:sigma-B regulation protein RsbU (phosphoserine phosphatase)